MPEIRVNDRPMVVAEGTTAVCAILRIGNLNFKPLCGMGICFECRVTIDGRPHQRSCQIVVRDGMEIQT